MPIVRLNKHKSGAERDGVVHCDFPGRSTQVNEEVSTP